MRKALVISGLAFLLVGCGRDPEHGSMLYSPSRCLRWEIRDSVGDHP